MLCRSGCAHGRSCPIRLSDPRQTPDPRRRARRDVVLFRRRCDSPCRQARLPSNSRCRVTERDETPAEKAAPEDSPTAWAVSGPSGAARQWPATTRDDHSDALPDEHPTVWHHQLTSTPPDDKGPRWPGLDSRPCGEHEYEPSARTGDRTPEAGVRPSVPTRTCCGWLPSGQSSSLIRSRSRPFSSPASNPVARPADDREPGRTGPCRVGKRAPTKPMIGRGAGAKRGATGSLPRTPVDDYGQNLARQFFTRRCGSTRRGSLGAGAWAGESQPLRVGSPPNDASAPATPPRCPAPKPGSDAPQRRG